MAKNKVRQPFLEMTRTELSNSHEGATEAVGVRVPIGTRRGGDKWAMPRQAAPSSLLVS